MEWGRSQQGIRSDCIVRIFTEMKGTDNNPITHNSDGPRGYKICKCCKCGIVQQCTPKFDFYFKAGEDVLHCETCFWGALAEKGVRELKYES